MLTVEDEELQAARKAYDAHISNHPNPVYWDELGEAEQESWKRVAVAVIEFVDFIRS